MTPAPPPQPDPKNNLEPRHASGASAKTGAPVLKVILAVLLCMVAAGLGYLGWQQYQIKLAADKAAATPVPTVNDTSTDSTDANLVANPIDFTSLKTKNPEIYAWLYIPNTKVNYPLVQSGTDDFFYLTHNADREESVEGALFTELANNTLFTDPVTVVYGHNIQDELMFSSLHYFENVDFFNNNETAYIYRPGHILTYRIIAANQYDDRHILNSFDFSNKVVRQRYFDSVLNPESLLKNVRTGTTLTVDDKIVQLSTCMTDYSYESTRYLVTGVLVNDQATR